VVLLSLFDGIGGAKRSLDMLGLGTALFVASETDAEACRVTRYAWGGGARGRRRDRH